MSKEPCQCPACRLSRLLDEMRAGGLEPDQVVSLVLQVLASHVEGELVLDVRPAQTPAVH